MKILLITSFFPPTHTAGTEKRTFGYAKILRDRGHSIQVLCAGKWDEGERYWNGHGDEIYQGIPVRRIHLNWQKSPDPNGYLYCNPQVAEFLRGCLAEWQPDVVHITSCLTLSASIIAAAKDFGLPVVLTLTDYWFACQQLSLLKYDGSLCDGRTDTQGCLQCMSWNSSAYQRVRNLSSERVATQMFDVLSRSSFLSRQRGTRGYALNISQRRKYLISMLDIADIVTAPSNHLRETLCNAGIDKEILVIHSGHDLSWLKGYSQKSFSNAIRFGYIGQFIRTKGVHLVLAAFSEHNWQGNAELHLFGNPDSDPVYWQELKTIPNRYSQKIYFHGAFPHEKLGDILSEIDVLAVPSVWHENNPRVIQEAFACKTPVIASDVGGISEFVEHETNGLLFERDNVQDLLEQMKRIVHEPELLEQLRTGIPPVKSIEDEVLEFEAIYQNLLACTSLSS